MSAMLTRDQILAAQDLPRELVHVPEWGGDVWVRTLMVAERDDFEASYLESRNGAVEVNRRNLRAKLIARCVVDDAGALLFTLTDIDALGAKSASAVDRVFAVAARLNRLTPKDAEDLAKN